MSAPVRYVWEGDAFRPASPYHQKLADAQFVIGETYHLAEHKQRSEKTHNHFFASLSDAWDNLPDQMRLEYPTPEHLRKKALIRKGYCDERSVVCASKADALRVASFIRPIDEYAIVATNESVVRIYTAQSQSRKAMGAKAFQESKEAVLSFLDDLLGVAQGETETHAGRAA